MEKGKLILSVDPATPGTDISAMAVLRMNADGTAEIVKTIVPYEPPKTPTSLRCIENN
jgi:hypothetical protein